MIQVLDLLNAAAPWLFALAALALVTLNAMLYWRERDLVPRYEAQRGEVPDLAQQPLVTALVPAWNEGDGLNAHVDSFLSLRYPHKQLVLVAGGREGDDTLARAQAYAADHSEVVAVPQRAGQGKQVALRDGLPHVQGEIVFLTDADCLYDDHSFAQTVAPIIRGDATVTSGASAFRPEQRANALVVFQWMMERLYAMKAPDESSGLMGRNCAVEIAALRASGGFDAKALSGTDYTLARQLIAHGETIRHVRHSQMATEYPADLRTYYNKHTRWLRNLIVIGWQTGDRATLLAGLVSAGIGVAFFALPLLALVVGPIAWAGWGVMLLHGGLSRLRYVALNRDVASAPLVLTALLTVPYDAFVWSAALWQSLTGRRIWK